MLLRDQVYNSIRRAILRCELRPGEDVREQVLADRYHVSRSPVRDALLRLSQERLVTVLPRQGYRINPITISDARDINVLRRLIEPTCAAAAARCDDAVVRQLDAFRAQSSQITEYDDYPDYNADFHSAIARLGGQGRIATLACDLAEQVARSQKQFPAIWDWASMRGMVSDHEKIIDAIQAHNPRLAFEEALGHVQTSATRLMNVLARDSGFPMETTDVDDLDVISICVGHG